MTRAEVEKLLENQRNAAARARPRPALVTPPPAPVEVRRTDATKLELWFPLPPSWNRTYLARAIQVAGRWTAQVYKSKEAKEYARAVEAICAQRGVRPWPATTMLRLSGVVAMERAGCDLDDRLKVWLDACQGFVFDDDEQVAEFGNLRRIVDSKRPGITATFEVIAVDRYGEPTLPQTAKKHGVTSYRDETAVPPLVLTLKTREDSVKVAVAEGVTVEADEGDDEGGEEPLQ